MKSFNKTKMLLIAAMLLPLSVLEANPGFSRQMNMDCMACHNQTMGQLNYFGRKFAASGFTMTAGTGMQTLINGEPIELGMPSVLNASVLLKARYVKRDQESSTGNAVYEDVGMDRGNLEVFKVSKLFLGGRIAENVGGYMHFMYDKFGGKFVFSHELGTGYWGITAYMEEDFGPFAGMEYYNTGLFAPLKLFENRNGTNAAQATDLAHGPATGLQLYYGGDELFMMAGMYTPATSQHEGLDIGSSVIPIARVAYAPTFGDWTVMLGGYYMDGTSTMSDMALDDTVPKASSATLIDITREAYGVDMQVEGDIAGASTVLILNAVLHNKTRLYNGTYVEELTFTNSGAEYKAADNKAFSAEVQVNPWDSLGFKAAYLDFDDKFEYTSPGKVDKFDRRDYTVGIDYSYRQNVRFAAEYTSSHAKEDTGLDSDTVYIYTMVGF